MALALAPARPFSASRAAPYWGAPAWTLQQMAPDPAARANIAAYRARLLVAASGHFQPSALPAATSPTADVMGSVAVAFAALDGARPDGEFERARWASRSSRQRSSDRAVSPTLQSFGASASVTNAISGAAEVTGVAADYLFRIGRRESSLDPYAGARGSSARGLYQFIEGTWLVTVRRYGAQHGLADEAAAIGLDGRGRAYVADPFARRQILALRYDPRLNALLAAEHTRENAGVLRGLLGREPYAGELYAAHVLGAQQASLLLRTVQHAPATPADVLFPKAAQGNRDLFYDRGTPRSAGGLALELYRRGES